MSLYQHRAIFYFGQPWASVYYDEDDGFHVTVRGIKLEEVATFRSEEIFPNIPIIFVDLNGQTLKRQQIHPADIKHLKSYCSEDSPRTL